MQCDPASPCVTAIRSYSGRRVKTINQLLLEPILNSDYYYYYNNNNYYYYYY